METPLTVIRETKNTIVCMVGRTLASVYALHTNGEYLLALEKSQGQVLRQEIVKKMTKIKEQKLIEGGQDNPVNYYVPTIETIGKESKGIAWDMITFMNIQLATVSESQQKGKTGHAFEFKVIMWDYRNPNTDRHNILYRILDVGPINSEEEVQQKLKSKTYYTNQTNDNDMNNWVNVF
jgi:hypothetical protein